MSKKTIFYNKTFYSFSFSILVNSSLNSRNLSTKINGTKNLNKEFKDDKQDSANSFDMFINQTSPKKPNVKLIDSQLIDSYLAESAFLSSNGDVFHFNPSSFGPAFLQFINLIKEVKSNFRFKKAEFEKYSSTFSQNFIKPYKKMNLMAARSHFPQDLTIFLHTRNRNLRKIIDITLKTRKLIASNGVCRVGGSKELIKLNKSKRHQIGLVLFLDQEPNSVILNYCITHNLYIIGLVDRFTTDCMKNFYRAPFIFTKVEDVSRFALLIEEL